MSSKILCLHGFLQNAKVFSEKSSGIRKLLKKNNIQTEYLDGPTVLSKQDLPFTIDDDKWEAIEKDQLNKSWFYHTDISSELNIETAINTVSEYIKEHGPFDGILGFSQGAALAAIVTNQIKTLVPDHPYFKVSILFSAYSFTEKDPNSADANALRITPKYQDSFQPPKDLSTKVIFIYGLNDNAVPGERSKFLYNIYNTTEGVDVKFFEHDGGHLVVNKKDFLRPVVEEITEALK